MGHIKDIDAGAKQHEEILEGVVRRRERNTPEGAKGRGAHHQGEARVSGHGLGWAGQALKWRIALRHFVVNDLTCRKTEYPLKTKAKVGCSVRAEALFRRRRGWLIGAARPTAAIESGWSVCGKHLPTRVLLSGARHTTGTLGALLPPTKRSV